MPRAVENYVQEIGRASRDGKLARCHMFLSDEDFYQLRRKALGDLLDSQSGFRLTNKLISTAKREFLRITNPDAIAKKSRKRKREDDEDECEEFEAVIDVFTNEESLKPYYNE